MIAGCDDLHSLMECFPFDFHKEVYGVSCHISSAAYPEGLFYDNVREIGSRRRICHKAVVAVLNWLELITSVDKYLV